MVSPTSLVFAGDLSDALSTTKKGFESNVQKNKTIRRQNEIDAARRAKERSQNRDRSKDVCYQMPSGSDVQTACLAEYPNAVRNERARNLLLGYCNSMGGYSELSKDLSYICTTGKSGCSVLDDTNAGYWCGQCGGTRRWLAVYSLGRIIQCYN